ncbi:MAG: Re/Si-specific NAD(P)(+) transhydrogenase subunit beta [Trueperella sp.]|uniref:Re/Si-specific NAD(P)(+) transhydrogenase subunit beta n=1 Tax=Trueperella sp. TaxID=2699835 RepID=UPI0025E5FFF2|nr:Re/Si-specific NAD(P)(+) transhydrogenase subunit beta [Trueperella sp.]MCI7305361.1 Re/Si-specific NAD(P)(+) transhydrogenase subunit beta [Trueperella sp.]MDY5404114.1 Re/Si-specific NAD(P)(+) transhydrogenase subunit beta [Trueperella sp.]
MSDIYTFVGFWQLSFQSLAYIAAALLFILALAGLSKQATAQRGNRLGMLGMCLVLVATITILISFSDQQGVVAALIIVALGIGAAVGIPLARKVEMTGMPELIAMLHSFVGLAAVLVGYNSFILTPGADTPENAFHMGEVGLAVFIGAVTFTGSIIAFLKLSGRMSGKPLTLPGRNWLNLGAILASLAFIIWFAHTRSIGSGMIPLALLTVVALLLGLHLVAAIGGGDMPVVVSMLNSYSGWAAAMAGFTLGNDLLIIVGALVGSSGAYLSYIMCQAMNRSFISVILGGFGSDGAVAEERDYGTHREITAPEVAEMLATAHKVVITPGYGMAVAQAQYPVAELTRRLREAGVDVSFAIHPVAGRLPGHMNVLLAEANVPYDIVYEMDEVNDSLSEADVVLVIGANDTVNPAAEEPGSPIAGMPVIKVWEAKNVIVFKRSMGNAGYAGVQNPLFFNENTAMLLGDAKDSVDQINAALKVNA